MHLQERETPIQVFDQADPLGQQMHGADAAAGHGFGALGQLIFWRLLPPEHRPGLVIAVTRRQTAGDSLLAVAQDLRVVSFHSKCLVGRLG